MGDPFLKSDIHSLPQASGARYARVKAKMPRSQGPGLWARAPVSHSQSAPRPVQGTLTGRKHGGQTRRMRPLMRVSLQLAHSQEKLPHCHPVSTCCLHRGCKHTPCIISLKQHNHPPSQWHAPISQMGKPRLRS